jgi:hypothetical protein
MRIVVAGDGRADYVFRPEDKDGLNTTINREMAQAVLDEKADMFLWTGDLVNVTNNDSATFKHDLLAWRAIMQPVYDHKIPVLPVRGNHELMCPEPEKAWDDVFSGNYALPANGPSNAENLTFYCVRGPVLVVGVDEYATGRETIDQTWLDQVLREHPEPFIFVYGHEPAFMDGHHPDTLDAHPANRDAMWESLIRAGARVFFCGHDHFYDHMVVVRATGDAGPEMHQFTAGTAGAPFYHGGPYAGANSYWKLTQVKHIENTYGYNLIEIKGNTATITFKGRVAPGKYVVMDSFSFEAK